MPTEQRRHTVAALVAQIAGPIDTGLLARGLAALEDAVSALRDQLAATTARADRLDLLVETERGRIVTIEAKAVAAEQGRDRAEAQAAELRVLLEQAEAAAEKARREAVHEARKAAQAFDAHSGQFCGGRPAGTGPPGAAQGSMAGPVRSAAMLAAVALAILVAAFAWAGRPGIP